MAVKFSKNYLISNFIESSLSILELFHVYEQTDENTMCNLPNLGGHNSFFDLLPLI
jgi:hypothetical protein